MLTAIQLENKNQIIILSQSKASHQIQYFTSKCNFYRLIERVTEVLKHKNTASKGWYSIMTTATTFKHNTKLLKSNLVTWVSDIIDKQGIHAPQFQPHAVL